MAALNCKSSTLISFLYVAFLLSTTKGEERRLLSDAYCERLSGLWSGTCFDFDRCSELCREKENAVGGTCNSYQCYCRYTCCARPSGTWHGPCFISDNCEKQCQQQEKADSGTCYHNSLHCDCLYKC